MTETPEPVRLACPLNTSLSGGCDFRVTLPEPPEDYRPTWMPPLRREAFAGDQAEVWTDEFRKHLGSAHTAAELLEHVAWEPHMHWMNDED